MDLKLQKEIKEYVKQPIEGLLYDLNLLPDQVNSAKNLLLSNVIIELHAKCERLEETNFSCGDANSKGNVSLSYKGGCKKELNIEDAYRCTGCGGYFHKACIEKHFELEKDHDFGRAELREQLEKCKNTMTDDQLIKAGF